MLAKRLLPAFGLPGRHPALANQEGGQESGSGSPAAGQNGRERFKEGCTLSGEVGTVEPVGRETLYHVTVENNDLLILSGEKKYEAGHPVRLTFESARIYLFDPEEKA